MASAAESVPAKENELTLWWDLLVGIIPLVALLPMLVFEASDLWSREYMRFIPLTVLAASVMVAMNLRQAVATRNPYRRWTSISNADRGSDRLPG